MILREHYFGPILFLLYVRFVMFAGISFPPVAHAAITEFQPQDRFLAVGIFRIYRGDLGIDVQAGFW